MKHLLASFAFVATPLGAAQISPADLDALPSADVIFLGEVHDNPAHHAHQARAIAQIEPAALVFEMLTTDQAAHLSGPLPDEDALRELLDWDATGWPDFSMYYPLFAAAPDAVVFGAALPRDDARAAMSRPLPDSFAGDAARFGLDIDLPPDQQNTREALQARAHCDALPEHLLPGMVAIQRLRDAMLAEAALRAFDETSGPVVVITGTGHARTDWGAPAALAHAAPDVQLLSLGQFEAVPDSPPPHDLWLVTDPHPRPDPCDAFR